MIFFTNVIKLIDIINLWKQGLKWDGKWNISNQINKRGESVS